jgi:DNA-binding CsgD family transcriptional regulator
VRLLERDAPVALLAEVCQAATEGRGGVVLVTGEPGIGKTALVTEFTSGLSSGRVLLGYCDDLSTPRPLGPLRDLAGAGAGPLAGALAVEGPVHAVHDCLLEELTAAPLPTVVVLEDVHWADDATIDVIRTVGRRIGGLPAVLVLTYRDGELAADHPLRSALASLPAGVVTRLPLQPLSRDAVAELLGPGADDVHALTGGNPFYVTELLAARPATLPRSVSDAVSGRVAELSPGSRRLVELVSVIPARTDTALLDVVLTGWAEAAEEPERRQLLTVGPRHVRFRHELARTAVEAALPAATRRRLHAEVLAALQRLGADAADLVHHAEAAGDLEALAASALPAARRAAALESNRESYAHYRRAARLADRLPEGERSRMFEELASAAYLVGRTAEALTAIDSAAEAHREAGDTVALGRCARIRSRLRWYAGDGAAARAEARLAVDLLEPLGESVELARACSGLSQLAILAGDRDETLRWGLRAAGMAQRLGDRATHAHALINLGVVRAEDDPDDTVPLEQAHQVADGCGDRHEAVRALVNNTWAQLLWVRPEKARRAAERASAYATTHEVDSLGSYAVTTIAWLHLRAGDWEAAHGVAEAAVAQGATVTQLLARTVLAELAVRRGDSDAAERLADVAEQADRTGELQRIQPVLELEIEWALTRDAAMPTARIGRAVALARTTGFRGWGGARLAAWAAMAGRPIGFSGPAAAPHAAMLAGDWRVASDAFGVVGWAYDRALLLSVLDDRHALGEALEIARAMGAEPLVGRVGRRMRALGMSVPHGRRESTRANPAGLTSRQVEVLRLVAEGLTNTEIADRLVVSARTAEHHVAAVLTKLDVPTRRAAARRGTELGLLAQSGISDRVSVAECQ